MLPTHHIGKLSQSVVLPHFNHAIAYVPEQPGLAAQFIDNTVDALDVGNLRWDDQGASSLLLDPKSGEFRWLDIPHQGPSYERFDQQIAISIDASGAAKMTDALTLRGTSAAAARKTLRSEVQAQKFYESLVSYLFPRATLTHGSAAQPESIDHPLVINTEADLSSSISAEGEELRLRLPSAFSLQHSVALATRKTSLDLATEKSSTFQIDATLADGLRLKTPPKSMAMKSACFEVSREVSQKGNALSVLDRFELRCAEIPVADYPAFRADVEKAAAELDAAVVFERAGKTAAKAARRAVH